MTHLIVLDPPLHPRTPVCGRSVRVTLAHAHASATNILTDAPVHRKADIVKKLDFVVQKEENFRAAQQAELAEAASAAVTAKFAGDKDLQAKALTQALDSISNPDKAGADVVGEMFAGYFSEYVASVKGATTEVEIPASVIEEAKAEILGGDTFRFLSPQSPSPR